MTETDEDEWTEAVDADIPRVDLVGHAANGSPGFLVMKQNAAGLLDPDFVRDLIAKTDAASAADPREMVTMTGSPAAIAALIHNAPIRKAGPVAEPDPSEIAKGDYEALLKAKYNADDLKRMATNGQAMKDESYPIADKEDLGRAIRAVGRGGADHDAIRRHVIARAKSLGASSEIPDNWAADGSLKKADAETEVTKDMGMPMDTEDNLDPCIVLAEPDSDEAPGSEADPGSPAWEAIDAATARKWTAIAARLRSALGVMADRENLEAATVDPDDAEAAMDLDDAACAVDYVIDTLASFAVDEQAEADDAVMAMVGKSIGALDPAHLDTIESLGALRKAGRTLSAANESALRAAIQALQQILASLPPAPVTKKGAGEPVAKTANEEPNMDTPTPSETVTAASGQEPAMGAAQAEPKPVAGQAVTDVAKATETADETAQPAAAAPFAKADKPPQVAVYDAHGNLVGVADPADITMIAAAKAPVANTDDDTTPDEPAAPAAEAAPPTDLTPAPAASVGTPADAEPADDDTLAKATETTQNTEAPQDVLKGSIQELVKAAIAEHSAPQGELIKTLEDRNRALEEQNAALVKHTAALEERLTKVENQPAVMAIASNGAIPPAHLLRGQDHGARVDVTKAEQLRAAYKGSDDARQQKVLAEDLNVLAIEKLREIHSAGPR